MTKRSCTKTKCTTTTSVAIRSMISENIPHSPSSERALKLTAF